MKQKKKQNYFPKQKMKKLLPLIVKITNGTKEEATKSLKSCGKKDINLLSQCLLNARYNSKILNEKGRKYLSNKINKEDFNDIEKSNLSQKKNKFCDHFACLQDTLRVLLPFILRAIK